MRHTSPTTLHQLALDDIVVIGGTDYKVERCSCGRRYTLRGPNGNAAFETAHSTLEEITAAVRAQYAKNPTFKLGQKWRTRGGEIVTVLKMDTSGVPVFTDVGWHFPDGRSNIGSVLGSRDLIELISEAETAKEVPPLAVGQKWRTRGGEIVTVERFRGEDFAVKPVSGGDIAWWYKSHHSGSKHCHTPGVWHNSRGDQHEDTLVELISEAPPAAKSYTIVLTEDEARLLRDLHQRISGSPSKSRRGLMDAINAKLCAINAPCDVGPTGMKARNDLPDNIEIEDAWTVAVLAA